MTGNMEGFSIFLVFLGLHRFACSSAHGRLTGRLSTSLKISAVRPQQTTEHQKSEDLPGMHSRRFLGR